VGDVRFSFEVEKGVMEAGNGNEIRNAMIPTRHAYIFH
jgi:hypothetical protein